MYVNENLNLIRYLIKFIIRFAMLSLKKLNRKIILKVVPGGVRE